MRYVILVTVALGLAVLCVQSAHADDERYGESWSHQPAQKWTPRKSAPTGEADLVTLKNGVRFEGLILEEDERKIRLARYSGNTVSPHTLGLFKSDIASIVRVKPELRASLEPQVRDLLHAASLNRQLARTAAARQQVAETVEEAHREAIAAAQHQRWLQQANPNPGAYGTTPGAANHNRSQYQMARAPAVARPPTVTRGLMPRPARQVRRVGGG
jgi:hypothetical protein